MVKLIHFYLCFSIYKITEKKEEFYSLLVFKDISAKHSGKYTCYASNVAAKVNFTAELQVRGEWAWQVDTVFWNSDTGWDEVECDAMLCVSVEALRRCFKINHTGFVRQWLPSLPFFGHTKQRYTSMPDGELLILFLCFCFFLPFLFSYPSLRHCPVARSRFSGASVELRTHGHGHYAWQYNIDKLRGGRISDSSYYLVQRAG